MHAVRFRELLESSGPFVSVYYEESVGLGNGAGAIQLDHRWQGLRERLERLGADKSMTDAIKRAVLRWNRPAIRRGGRAVVVGPEGVLFNEVLLRPTDSTVVRVSELPYIVPILAHGLENPNYLLAMVDATGADISAYLGGELHSESVDGALGRVAARLTKLLDETLAGTTFVAGTTEARANLMAALPTSVCGQVVSLPICAPRGEYDFDELKWAAEAWFLDRQLSAVDDAVVRFDAEAGRRSGRAVQGLGAVCSALRQGTIDTLIVGDIGDAVVVADEGMTTVAPRGDDRELGSGRVMRADEALPLFAISAGASLVRTDERIAPTDGIAAVLRHTPSS
ncbi:MULTISPECIES: baeRF2 domain-containing protein [Mycobacterium]|uniref:Uncharacterized protein n=1 Tax=Mycobacterium kiyosense TaxID=2871094 RepID=A0A9P3V0V5_9MYCO|nr:MULTISPECIES: hypothetical protein [Mycobacterium]BDE11275.1 hypothetical protein MKCMC460_01350 [Mycobacterium sp. 20KCMC460]GLB85222.1 hypothetical protein SRL2020028_44780 [Mycobacterium kiyosense]GLB91603.1 hypothetical protein SRL2020130_44200 [Mycobacterium kiyosense]GLB96881.1 hypothetical protein SRL2020226_36570 [Mycobacterium kiyosense]GLC02547.1 hypothetical protein SRL2020400_31380 [Mycobacterium kiyosense]